MLATNCRPSVIMAFLKLGRLCLLSLMFMAMVSYISPLITALLLLFCTLISLKLVSCIEQSQKSECFLIFLVCINKVYIL